MAFSLNKLKNILNNNKDNQLAGSGSLDPEIGFKLSLHPVSKNVYITVIGARHLPSLFGLSRAHGYLVKVTSTFVFIIINMSFGNLIFVTIIKSKRNIFIEIL